MVLGPLPPQSVPRHDRIGLVLSKGAGTDSEVCSEKVGAELEESLAYFLSSLTRIVCVSRRSGLCTSVIAWGG